MLRTLIISFSVVVPLVCATSHAAEPVDAAAGQKLDNGLGGLPHYSQWHLHGHLRHLVPDQVAHAAGEKLDSGLGDLPPYAQWDHYPELKRMAGAAQPRTAATGENDARDRVAVIRR